MVFLVVFVLALVMPSAFIVESPGVVLEVDGGDRDAKGMVEVDGVRTYPSDTSFYMTTVSALGTASAGAPAATILASLVNPRWQVVPVRALYPQQMTFEEQETRSKGQMASSQSAAETVALEKAGYEVTMKLSIGGVLEGSPAEGKLEAGDVLTFLRAGERTVEATSYSRFVGLLEGTAPGTQVVVGYERDGKPGEVSFATVAPEKDATGWVRPGSRLAVAIVTEDIDSEAKISFALEDVGGPSAGSMFSLAIYDELTEGSLGGKRKIAGTGTVSLGGDIGPIGGIVHKMRGAADAGAEAFLAPALNCDEVVGHEPKGMDVFAVRSFDEARKAVEAIGKGSTKALTTCETIVAGMP